MCYYDDDEEEEDNKGEGGITEEEREEIAITNPRVKIRVQFIVSIHL